MTLPIQLAFNELLEFITPEIMAVKAYDMNILPGMYRESLKRKSVDCEGYTAQKLKSRLITHFKDNFPPAVFPCIIRASLFKRNTLILLDVISGASSLPGTKTPIAQSTYPAVHHDANEMTRMMYFVSKAIGDEIAHCEGINLQPLNVDEYNISTARFLLAPSLYWLFKHF